MALRNLEPFVTKLKDHDKKKPVSSSTLSSHAARGSPPALVGEDDGTTLSLLSENEIDDAHMTVFDIFQSIIKKYEAKGISYEEAYVQACLEFEAKVLMDTEGEKSEVVSKAEGRDEKDKNRRKANVAFDFVSHAKDKLEAEETKTSEQELPISNSNSSSVPLKTNVSGGERDVLNNQGIVDSSPPVSSGDTDSDSEFETVSLRTVKYDKVYDDSESDDVFEFVDDPSAGETEHNGTVRRWQNLWRR
ncbi:hypothetical protein B0J11DRAFT_536303 [Dendryphion nanum]|uniref:Uncharacterized protein n=1 Tax=Dendryphion nanum TaxID=256645 RepID=A0A9P9IF83_9PLEO|nr:hypothetical protein B0J11DRAFT_536303 [Dendryphion nanum]